MFYGAWYDFRTDVRIWNLQQATADTKIVELAYITSSRSQTGPLLSRLCKLNPGSRTGLEARDQVPQPKQGRQGPGISDLEPCQALQRKLPQANLNRLSYAIDGVVVELLIPPPCTLR